MKTYPFYVINDNHNGAIRSGGTTPKSAWALRQYLLAEFCAIVQATDGGVLMILGDLLDTHAIPYSDLLEVYTILLDWVRRNPDTGLILVPGNHDLSKTTTTMSSFQFLCKLLSAESNVTVVDEPKAVNVAGNVGWVIPHMPNQDLFDIALESVPPNVKYLFLHCNFDNKFAQEADHSLNLSQAQAEKLPVERIIIAHEHQRKIGLSGKVILPGNQTPSSVADCLGNKEKYMLRITDKIEYIPTWQRESSFIEMDWRALADTPEGAQFVRVTGEASAVEASAVVTAISKLRNTHDAFVITNAVSLEGRSLDAPAASLEAVQGFNILEAVLKKLNKDQQVVVTALLEEEQ
jgi:metallophosphoesterase superfamily enzyme